MALVSVVPVIASVAGLCEDDFPTIAAIINAAKPDLIEVNLSCPNIPGKPQIGYDPDASERLLKQVIHATFENQMAPHLDDRVDMLDEQRTFLIARVTGCATPQNILANRFARQ